MSGLSGGLLRSGLTACCAIVVAGCGGGDGSPPLPATASAPAPPPATPPTPQPSPPTPAPALQITLTTAELKSSIAAGDEVELSVTGLFSGSMVSDPFVQLVSGDGRFSTARFERGQTGSFTLKFDTLPVMPAGDHEGTLLLQACEDAACTRPLANAQPAALPYRLTTAAIGPWGTHQANASHNGSVPVRLNARKFRKVWDWTRPVVDEPIGGINAVATGAGRVFVTTDVYFGTAILHALDPASGAEAWRYNFGYMPALNPPGFSNGKVYAATMGHSDTWFWQFDADTGAFVYKTPFESQWGHILAPTVFGNRVYLNGGYYGGVTYSFRRSDGAPDWQSPGAGDDDMSTPAVNDTVVAYYSGTALQLYDPGTGADLGTIADPNSGPFGYSYHSAPILGSMNNVLAFSGGAFSGRASANVEQYEERLIVSYNLATKTANWTSARAYKTQPAVADGVVYAGTATPLSFDAIDEATGQILWSWQGTGADSAFHRNVVVTRTHVFVSTDIAVYAIDLKTRRPVWTYPMPGMLALDASTPTRMLYIATGAVESDGKLVAIRLN